MLTSLEQYVPLGIEDHHLDDPLLWNIFLYASIHQTTSESAYTELADTPSGNTVREHLQAALGPSAFEVFCLEDQFNATFHAQLPGPRRHQLRWGSLEVGLDLVEIPYPRKPSCDPDELRRARPKPASPTSPPMLP